MSENGESTECAVCHQKTPKTRVHYGGVSCYSCRAFFRRNTMSGKIKKCKIDQNCSVSYIYQQVSSAIHQKVKKAELQDLFDENMSLRLSGLGFLINEVSSGNFQTLRMKILLNSELYMTSISQAAIRNYLFGDTLGSLTFINGIPEIPDIDKKILENILRIQNCTATKVSQDL